MKRESIEEQLIVERYLQGKLSPTEEAAFEETYLGDPELVEQLELAERLKGGLSDLAERGELPAPPSRRWPALLHSPQYAAAASVLLVGSLIVASLLYVENAALKSSVPAVTQAPPYRVLPLYAVRGTQGAVIAPADDGEVLVLLVDPGPAEYTRFRAAVRRAAEPTAEPIWVTGAIEPGYEDALAIGVPSERLPPGDYEVVIEGLGDDETLREVARVPFRIDAREP